MIPQYKPHASQIIPRCLCLPVIGIKNVYKRAYEAGIVQFISAIFIPILMVIGAITFFTNLDNPTGMFIGLLVAFILPFVTFVINMFYHCYSYAEKTLIDDVKFQSNV